MIWTLFFTFLVAFIGSIIHNYIKDHIEDKLKEEIADIGEDHAELAHQTKLRKAWIEELEYLRKNYKPPVLWYKILLLYLYSPQRKNRS